MSDDDDDHNGGRDARYLLKWCFIGLGFALIILLALWVYG